MLLPQSENNAGYFKKEAQRRIYNRIAHKICQEPLGASLWTPRLWAGWSQSVCMDGQKEGRVGGWTDEWVGFGLTVH